MNWNQLRKSGYSLEITKRHWSVFYKIGVNQRQEVARGRKRASTSQASVESRAHPYATADFVKRRVNNELFIDNLFTLREGAKKKLMEWFSLRMDQGMYDLIRHK